MTEVISAMDREVGTKEAAALLGFKYDSAVKKLIEKGQLVARKEDAAWRIKVSTLQEFQRIKVGRPHEFDKHRQSEDRDDGTVYRSTVKHHLRLIGMSIADFTQLMGIHESLFYRIEQGPSAGAKFRNPSAGYRRKAAEILKVPVEQLFTPVADTDSR